jgi:hypothetical protein
MTWGGTTIQGLTGVNFGASFRSIVEVGSAHVVCIGTALLLAEIAWLMRGRAKLHAAEWTRERRLREEFEAYAQMDATLRQGASGPVDSGEAAKGLARRVCRLVAEKSSFTRVMVLLRNAEGRLACTVSVGVDDLTVAALERWGDQVVAEERGDLGRAATPGALTGISLLGKSGAKNIQIPLGEWREFDAEVASWKMSGNPERRQWRRAIGIPVRVNGPRGRSVGRVAGVIVVCTDGLSVPIRDASGRLRLDRLISPMEMLAGRMGIALEFEALGERLLRAERQAGIRERGKTSGHAPTAPTMVADAAIH